MLKGKEKKKQSEETKQALESDLDMTEILELSDQELKITMINMLKTLMGKSGQYTRTDG